MNDPSYPLVQALERYKELINQERQPETLEEDIFLLCYEDGMMGTDVMQVYLKFCDNANVGFLELHAAFMGYSLGESQGKYLISNQDEDEDQQPH